ncbi:hypothetical protein CDEST_04344 [Colletotrichum destructivum]|uniref:Uncharacterized protein n=1 Tax=Colletotrichum destructivum TaxID=34406 RepID=A0AAX4I7H1_9PEZI|nr:hypothetical protein CDEST_04344 [Colletotrichum destructivum]
MNEEPPNLPIHLGLKRADLDPIFSWGVRKGLEEPDDAYLDIWNEKNDCAVSADDPEALCWFDITVINTGDLPAYRSQQIPRRLTARLNLQRDEDDQKRFDRAAIKAFGAVAQLPQDGFKATLAVIAIV